MRLLLTLLLLLTSTSAWWSGFKKAVNGLLGRPGDKDRLPCGEVGFCLNITKDGTGCSRCDCPDGFGEKDCRPHIARCTAEQNRTCGSDHDCTIDDLGKPHCHCHQTNCDAKIDPCSPNPCQNFASCSRDGCKCPSGFKGDFLPTECDNYKRNDRRSFRSPPPVCTVCMENKCLNNGTCIPTLGGHGFSCMCPYGYEGNLCQNEIPCVLSNPCNHGGECRPDPVDRTRAKCRCLSIWKGERCETYNPCHSVNCVHGNCTVLDVSKAKCLCEPGKARFHIPALDIDECATRPCLHYGSCTDKVNGYECRCLVGTHGKNCEIDENDCRTEHPHNTKCNITDHGAICHDLLNYYQCSCSPQFTGRNCETPMMIWRAMQSLGADKDEYDKLLHLLYNNPEIVKELLPFVLALQSSENQTMSSWDFEDLFVWASFEGVELDTKKDFVKWHSPVLGNCFTFNHDSQPEKMPLRYAGEQEGFRALMRVRQDEYLDWIDTASLLVFVHSSTDSVFGESLRFQARPGGETSLMISEASFERLGGAYGTCVKDKSEVKSYYYSGEYHIDGCFRSCYQDAVLKSCGCMDPRYPMPRDRSVSPCELPDRYCVMEVTERRGDPSKWQECRCSLPCSNGQFSVRAAHSRFPQETNRCDLLKFGDSRVYKRCLAEMASNETALINVYFPQLIQAYFREEPKMDLNKFVSMLGGLLGVLMGFSFITLAEFVELSSSGSHRRRNMSSRAPHLDPPPSPLENRPMRATRRINLPPEPSVRPRRHPMRVVRHPPLVQNRRFAPMQARNTAITINDYWAPPSSFRRTPGPTSRSHRERMVVIESDSSDSDDSVHPVIADSEDESNHDGDDAEFVSSDSELSVLSEDVSENETSHSDNSENVEDSRMGDETDEDIADHDDNSDIVLEGSIAERSVRASSGESMFDTSADDASAPPTRSLSNVRADTHPAEPEGVPLDVNVHECIVCMSAITSEGSHRAVVLKCGHLFGRACVEQWLRTASKTCPSCKSKAILKDIRLVYARSVSAEDNSELLEAQQRANNLATENIRLMEKNDELEKKLKNALERSVENSGSVIPEHTGIRGLRVYYETKMRKVFPEAQKSVGTMDSAAQFIYTIVSNTKNRLFKPFGVVRVDVQGQCTMGAPCHSKRIRFVCANPLDPDVVASVGDDRTLVTTQFTGTTPSVKSTLNLSVPAWSITWMSNSVVVVGRSDGKVDVLNVQSGDKVPDNGYESVVDEKIPIIYCHYVLTEHTLITITNRACSAYRSGVKYNLIQGLIRSYAFDKYTNKLAVGIDNGGMQYAQYSLQFSARGVVLDDKLNVDIPVTSTRMMHGALFQNSAGGECWALYDEDNRRVYIRDTAKSPKPIHVTVNVPDDVEFSQVLATSIIDDNIPKYRITLVSTSAFCQFLLSC
ncbi:hypothetical protein QR680_008672 [Steinernema hermaphroditum]|uniref:Uncharacterized protein n=1 Tax=Steinernema hermaphroditum TaxID=289476 RepID=A0AA39IJF5_9BILA|nr:hypothetical protein QR680_008672 [Steinernema hermaphroditum]